MDFITSPNVEKLAGTEPVRLDHYLLAAYASTESFAQKIVAIIPGLEEPIALMPAGSRTANVRKALGIVAGDLDQITGDVAATATSCRATFFGLRQWPLEDRRRAHLQPHDYPLAREIRG